MPVSRKTALKVIYWNAILAVLIVGLGAAALVRRIHRHDALIVKVAKEHGMDPRLISAVVWTESRFDAEEVGKAGEIGLMQVTEGAAQEWARASGVKYFIKVDLFDPETNLRAGTWYLARAVKRWSHLPDPLPYALAEYNAGAANARRWAELGGTNPRAFCDSITYPTTQRYVRNILKRYRGRV
ncbi:MAG: lytic transglycosylase domain-containing protein [Kiritimatiellae bacterium]|nr:lytic transglycosylase domain-containing protein [Kiritimatiellia bacterium]